MVNRVNSYCTTLIRYMFLEAAYHRARRLHADERVSTFLQLIPAPLLQATRHGDRERTAMLRRHKLASPVLPPFSKRRAAVQPDRTVHRESAVGIFYNSASRPLSSNTVRSEKESKRIQIVPPGPASSGR